MENSRLNPISLFLTYAQILESYHRQRYDGCYVDTERFKKISKKIRKYLKNMDEINEIENENHKIELKNKITSSVKFSYEFTLKDRLLEIFADLKSCNFFEDILEKFTAADKIDEFSNLIKDNRNYYTHYGKRKDNILDDANLIELNEALDCIINLIFLKELKFSDEDINSITKKSRMFALNTYVDWM